MSRRLGSLGCTGPEARDRLKRLLKMGVESLPKDENTPLTPKERGFIRDMVDAVRDNDAFEPSYGQIAFMQDIHDKYLL